VQKTVADGRVQFAHHTVSVADIKVGKDSRSYNSFSGIKVVCNNLGDIRPV